MAEKTMHSWQDVNELMNDDYRELVIKEALAYLATASPELRRIAKDTINRTVQINGFRQAVNAPQKKLRQQVSVLFRKNKALVPVIISLWAEKEKELIEHLATEARRAGTPVCEQWDWSDGIIGYYDSDDVPELHQLAVTLGEDRQSPEKDHLLLAVLWLSRSLVEGVTQEGSSPGDEADPGPEATGSTMNSTFQAENVETGPTSASPVDTPDSEPRATFTSLDISDLEGKSISGLSDYWETQSADIIGARDAALSKVEELRASGMKSGPSEMRKKMKQLDAHLKEWEILQTRSEELVDYIQARISRELQLRPDIKQAQPEVSELSEHPSETELMAILPTVFQAINNYDRRKAASMEKAASLKNELINLEQSLSLWKSDVIPLRQQIQQLDDPHEFSLQQLLSALENAKKVLQDAKDKRLHARSITVRRILDTLKKLHEMPGAQEFQSSKYGTSPITDEVLNAMPGRELQDVEREILTLFNHEVARANSGNSQKIAASLRATWNDGILEQLLGHLAAERKDLEAVLLEMAASAVHPRLERSVYSRAIARSLFSGVTELSTKVNPYYLLNKLATYFFLGWTSSDPTARYERCVLALAALAGNDTGLPPGFLWQVETDWPEPSMPSWDHLWQSMLMEEDIEIYTDQKVLEIESLLEGQQKEVEILFAKDGGHYLRVSSIKSDRHRVMMTNSILPQFFEKYTELTKLKKQFESSRVEKHPRILGELQRTMDVLERAWADKELEEIYEKAITEFNIDDINPFHIKVCMRVILEISTAIGNYGKTLLILETLRSTRRDGLNYQVLHDELKNASNVLVQHSLDQIAQGSLKARAQRNEETESRQGVQYIILKLLSDSSCFDRLPRTISFLVQNSFDWERLLATLLLDIETPLDNQAAARLLLERQATYQVLQVVQQLPLDIQKSAQTLHRDQEKHINDMENELLRLGGDSEWAKPDYELGRWGYLTTRFVEEIAKRKKTTEEEHQRYEVQAFAVRDQINRLDMNVFKSRSNIPVGMLKILQKGLDIARKATEQPRLLPQLKEYLDEMDYRLNREAWIETELENATQELEKQLVGTQDEININVDAEHVLNALNAGDVTKLGLDPENLEDSKVTTRVNILDNWLAIRNFRNVLSAGLSRVEINKIRSLFSYFARMHQMQHSRGADGNYMSYENPIVHEYWELRFPRTPALAKQCVMIALPGNPPSADDLQSMDEFLEKEDFLAAHFVFIFIPGCNNKIAKRFRQNYSKQSLVLIDEPALLRMILAERENSMVPLGKLRPLMLNATGANADIFTVNQSVNSHTAIFFGRDALVERIASSGDNYAIYGGRRIGKSSVLKALEQLLEARNRRVISYSLEGDTEYSEQYISRRLASLIGIQQEYEQCKDLKNALFSYFDANPNESIVLILDEIDRYISENRERHTLIEALRATSDRFEHRFRVIIAGFMELYDCLSGRGPYTPTSDPWGRMLNNIGPLENLKPPDAEKIVQEGFLSILGWSFEHRAIPRRIVERTGGHPAFVQYFCLKLQEQVSKRGDQTVTLKDIDMVFCDDTTEKSFIWFVRKTLEMNLSDPTHKRKATGESISDPVSRYLLLWLALEPNTTQTFTLAQLREIANLSKIHIPEKVLLRSLDLLTVTSVVREKSSQLYEFTVPDYPMILNRLGEGSQLESLENELKNFLGSDDVNE
jgi:hypothetical protein